jgi:glycolate oxidase iron-sulfur subunit
MAASKELEKCVHCGLCLNACPTYRELHVEMDSPRGRIYQMVQVAGGAPITDAYREHIDLCLACRACETACPSGVRYGVLIENARAEIADRTEQPLLSKFVFGKLLPSQFLLRTAGRLMKIRQAIPIRMPGRLGELESLAPRVETPFFRTGAVYPAQGERKHKVAFVAGCIANICFARLNDATIRVLQRNGCEVHVPAAQTCCGALHVHAGYRKQAQRLAAQNVAAFLDGGYDAILTNAGGCGSTLKEYGELLDHDARAEDFANRVKDVSEFLASIDFNGPSCEIRETVTYQDSCHLAHGQKVRSAPRALLKKIPGLTLKEMRASDHCCGSAGIYNVVHTDMSMALLEKKMEAVNATRASRIVTANPGCMLQLRAGVEKWGRGQRVSHVVEMLDEAYG